MVSRLVGLLLVAAVWANPAVAGCLDRVVVWPFGTILPYDTVSLEVPIYTSTTPAHLYQPTEVSVIANEVLVQMYVAGGHLGAPDHIVEMVELGTFAPGTYEYRVVQDPTGGAPFACSPQERRGTFCVDDPACTTEACRCPEQRATHIIVDVGTLPGPQSWRESWAHGMNDRGQVVGRSHYGSTGSQVAFLWDRGIMADLGVPSASSGRAINNLGQVAGYSGNSGFLWSNGSTIALGDIFPNAINEATQIVGWSGISALLWEDGVLTDLNEAFGVQGRARDINNYGEIIVGSSLLDRYGQIRDLGTLGGPATEAYGLNDLGQVVGVSMREGDSYPHHGFLWTNGEMLDIGAIGGFEASYARSINNFGMVVGSPTFLYDPVNGVRDFRDLLPFNTGWSELYAEQINNAGQITGHGFLNGKYLGFFITPIANLPCGSGEVDCQPNGSPDTCDLEYGISEDCNGNDTPDECDISSGASDDCNANDIPDECEPDCNGNGFGDDCDVSTGTSDDCNANNVPDECEGDCDADGLIDACDPNDADGDGVPDACDQCPGVDDSVCDDSNECTLDSCIAGNQCVNDPAGADGLACDDANACTENTTCLAGTCTNGVSVVCDDGLWCNGAESCDSLLGCRFGTHRCAWGFCDEAGRSCMPADPPEPAIGIHGARKHRYLSIDTSGLGPDDTALRVDLVEMKRCSGLASRTCTIDDDCDAVQPGSGTCIQHEDVFAAGPWWVQAAQEESLGCLPGPCGPTDQFARVDIVPHFQVWSLATLHVGDCEIIPVATYEIRACVPPEGTICGDPLVIGTVEQPFISPGFRGNYGDVAGTVKGAEFGPPDGVANVVDVSAYQLTAQNYGTANTPQTHPTWVDLNGPGPGQPPQYILNVADLGQILKALQGASWTTDPGNLNPGDCP